MEMRNALGLITILLLFDAAVSFSSSPIVIQAKYGQSYPNITNASAEYVYLYPATNVSLNKTYSRLHNYAYLLLKLDNTCFFSDISGNCKDKDRKQRNAQFTIDSNSASDNGYFILADTPVSRKRRQFCSI